LPEHTQTVILRPFRPNLAIDDLKDGDSPNGHNFSRGRDLPVRPGLRPVGRIAENDVVIDREYIFNVNAQVRKGLVEARDSFLD